MSPICLTLSSIWGWKLYQDTHVNIKEKLCLKKLQGGTEFQRKQTKNKKTQTCPPDGKDAAEVVHDAVELVLQLLKEVARLHIELGGDRTS